MENSMVQLEFFKQIRSKLPSNISLAEEVAEVLGISNDSAYRRIRGEKPISLEEAQHLAMHFQLSLDAIMNLKSGSTVFYGSWLGPEHFNFEEYLKNLLIMTIGVNQGRKKMIYYEAKDFPPFHYFHFPELAAFKYFFWMKTILNYKECSKMCFEDNELGGPLHTIGTDIIKTYTQIPTAEIWSMETINSSIRQIEYYREAGVFRNPESIHSLYDQISAMLEHIKDQAEYGEKFMLGAKPHGGPRYELYYNDAYLGHNTILTETDGVNKVYINHGVLNLMMTNDEDFSINTRRYFDNTIKKSALISSVNEKERNRFFKAMQEKIAHARTFAMAQQKETPLTYL